MSSQFTLSSFLSDPQAFLFKIEANAEQALVVRLSDADLQAAAFVDDRMLQVQRQAVWMPLAELLSEAPPLAPPTPSAIFHIGHCGSTLLSRMLGALPAVLSIREPLVLRTLAELQRVDAATARFDAVTWERLLRRCLALLQRRAADRQRVVVKATSSCNGLVGDWLDCDEQVHGVLMHIDLRSYLCTMLKSPTSRFDAENFIAARLADLHAALGDDALRLYQLNQAERIALGWIAEMQRFGDLAQRYGARLLRLDFADLLADPSATLARVAGHLRIEASAGSVNAALGPQISGRYAKATDHPYSRADRQADLQTSAELHPGELRAGLAFAEGLLEGNPVLAGLRKYLGS